MISLAPEVSKGRTFRNCPVGIISETGLKKKCETNIRKFRFNTNFEEIVFGL